MDHQRDHAKFKKLVARLCDTLRGPNTPIISDELVESWWKALRHVELKVVEHYVDAYLAKADDSTRFPRPAQMRPKDAAAPEAGELAGNPARDYWRSTVVHEFLAAIRLGLATGDRLPGFSSRNAELLVIEHRETLGASLRKVLDEACDLDRQYGRTAEVDKQVQLKVVEVSRAFRTEIEYFESRMAPQQAAA